jgi:ABC-type transport system substrate-binding protein
MNALDVMKYGNLTFLGPLAALPSDRWETDGVCGIWSVKNIVAHIASYEWVMANILRQFTGGGPTPHLDTYLRTGMAFNDEQVGNRKSLSAAETLTEYEEAHAAVMALAARVSTEQFRAVGTLPWYGAEYSVDDYITYAVYGHKREHIAQVNVFRDRIGTA